MSFRRLVVALVALAVLAPALWVVAGPLLVMDWRAVPPGPPPREVPHAAVRVTATDGVALAAWWLPAAEPKAAIVLVHGLTSNKGDLGVGLPGLAADLVGRGYSVLAIDLRNHGESADAPGGPGMGEDEARDVRGAVDWLAGNAPGLRVAVIGVSAGGSAAIHAAVADPRIEALVTLDTYPVFRPVMARAVKAGSGLPDWAVAMVLWGAERLHGLRLDRGRPIDVAGGLGTRPWLVIQNMADPLVTQAEARALAATCPCATLWLTPGPRPSEAEQWAAYGAWGGHAHSYALYRDAFVERVAEFLDGVFASQFG